MTLKFKPNSAIARHTRPVTPSTRRVHASNRPNLWLSPQAGTGTGGAMLLYTLPVPVPLLEREGRGGGVVEVGFVVLTWEGGHAWPRAFAFA